MQKQYLHNIENNGVKRIGIRWTLKTFLRCVHDVRHPPTLYSSTQSVEIFYNHCGFSALIGQIANYDYNDMGSWSHHKCRWVPLRHGPSVRIEPEYGFCVLLLSVSQNYPIYLYRCRQCLSYV